MRAAGGEARHGGDSPASRSSIGDIAPVRNCEVDRRRRHRHRRDARCHAPPRLEIVPILLQTSPLRATRSAADDRHVRPGRAASGGRRCCRNDRLRNAVLAELPGGERSALVARARLVDPSVDARPCRAPCRSARSRFRRRRWRPSGIAVGEDVDRLAGFFLAAMSSISARPWRPIAWLMAISSALISAARHRRAACARRGRRAPPPPSRRAPILRLIAVGRVASNTL